MVFFVVVVVLSVTLLVRWWFMSSKWRQLGRCMTGPIPNFLIGNVGWAIKLCFQKSEKELSTYLLQHQMGYNALYQKEGYFLFWLVQEPVISVLRPDLLERILSSSVSLEKSFEYSFLHKWLGTGLLTSHGPKWRTRRKLLTPCFHFRILEDFVPTFNEQSLVLVAKLKETSQNDECIDITPLVTLCTLDIVCETVMGIHIGAQVGQNLEYVTAIHNLGDFFNHRVIKPWLRNNFLFNLTATGRKFNRDLDIVHGFTKKVIKETKQSKMAQPSSQLSGENTQMECERRGGKRRQALMALLLDLHLNGQHLSEEDIREEVDTFMFEGHDTTAMALTFALYCIGLYPDVQRRIHEELDDIFGDDAQRHITKDDIRKMKYLDCTLKESKRLFPSVPVIGRMLNEDIEFEGKLLPKGTTIHCQILSQHRNPYLFANPEVFDPERFTPENTLKRHPYAFVPFSAGPRNCIGQKFATLEIQVVVANVLRHFKIVSLDPRDRLNIKFEFTLRPVQPVRLKFINRK